MELGKMGDHSIKKTPNPYRRIYFFLGVLAVLTAAIWTVGVITHG
jgi:hypothetical protein